MGCGRTFFDPNTGQPVGFMCGDGISHCVVCESVALHLCDYQMGKGKTCDAPMCDAHAIRVDVVRDNRLQAFEEDDGEIDWIEFCPAHAAIHKLAMPAHERT